MPSLRSCGSRPGAPTATRCARSPAARSAGDRPSPRSSGRRTRDARASHLRRCDESARLRFPLQFTNRSCTVPASSGSLGDPGSPSAPSRHHLHRDVHDLVGRELDDRGLSRPASPASRRARSGLGTRKGRARAQHETAPHPKVRGRPQRSQITRRGLRRSSRLPCWWRRTSTSRCRRTRRPTRRWRRRRRPARPARRCRSGPA